jgi:hypothetical protein
MLAQINRAHAPGTDQLEQAILYANRKTFISSEFDLLGLKKSDLTFAHEQIRSLIDPLW